MNKSISKSKLLKRRSLILGISKTLITSLVIGKLYYLQILQKSKYGKLSDSNKTKIKILYPERGKILDLYNLPIASNKIDYQLNILKEKQKHIFQIIKKLDNIIKFSKFDLDQINSNIKDENLSDFITIKKNLTIDELELFELMSDQFPYLMITKKKLDIMIIIKTFLMFLVMLVISKFNKNKKLSNHKFGISGVEKTLDAQLLGSDGWVRLEADSRGYIKKELKKKHAIPGKNIQN